MERVNPGDVLDCSLYVDILVRIAEEEPEEEPGLDLSSNHNFSFRCKYKCSFVPLRTTEADSLIVRQESLCLSDPQLKQLVTSTGKYMLRLDCSSAGGPRRGLVGGLRWNQPRRCP